MQIDSLLEIHRQLARQQDLETLLGVIVEHALGVTGAERGFLVLEEHGALRFDTALDSCRGDIASPELELAGSVVRDALSRMRPVRVSNAVEDPQLGPQSSVAPLDPRSILCTPFEITPELRGALYVDQRLREGAFDDGAERRCGLLAEQAALAILQVKRLEEIRALNRELERRVVEKEVDLQNARRALTLVQRPATIGTEELDVKEIVPISELEKRAIHSALEKTGGDKRKAAELLGISRAKIYQRLKDWQEG